MARIANATSTLGPLHFEDLEPHRFEDLVRQLVYDFRNWGSLEPTGRLGSDDGYDARGTEIVEGVLTPDEGDEEGDDVGRAGSEDRLWQIQCKRERSISPKKIAGYIEEMIPTGADTPYGVIFAAPADFSKGTRDVFRSKLIQKGVREFYLWGRADIEDVLFQPKNDHLLYAYFGISLQIRKRSQRSALRSILAIKKKAISHLGPIDQRSFKDVLIRDIDDNRYPHSELVPDFHDNPAWKMFHFVGHTHDGIRLLIRRYFAYRDVEYLPPKGMANLKSWDFTREGEARPRDPWDDDDNDAEAHYAVYQFWQGLDKAKQAFFEIVGRIRYENIIDIDPIGDIYAGCPHIYVKRVISSSLFERDLSYKLVPSDSFGGGRETYLPANAEELRQQIFPEKFPEPPR
jgi:hypothetical protein